MITTINPATEDIISVYEELTDLQVQEKLEFAQQTFLNWKKVSISERAELMQNLADKLRAKKIEYASIITIEMGKPITQSCDEIEKCAATAEYFAKNIQTILRNEICQNSFTESYVEFDPIGIILAIMPWNFPFWQALRAALPTISAGNAMVLKHASSVQGSAQIIENLFEESGFPKGVFTNLCISSSKVESIIRNPLVQAITLTGSESVGAKVASIAASEIKKSVMELGGSDPFIVFGDANLDLAVEAAAKSRLRNTGQACTAAKRFIIAKEIVNEFTEKLIEKFSVLKIGNPNLESTEIGPMSSAKAREEIEAQIAQSVSLGAKIIFGGKRIDQKGFYFEPTILTNVKTGMAAYQEEIFGPVASIIEFDSTEDAIQIANDHKYGLASSIWTSDLEFAKKVIPEIEAGSVFVNSPATSQIDMPFGGVKKSGFGRELSGYGVKEFLNIKSVGIK